MWYMCNNVGIIYTTCTLIRVRILWLAEILFKSMFQFTRTLCVWLKVVVGAWVYRVHLSTVYNRIHFVIIYTGCKLMYNKIATTRTPSVIWNNYLRQYSTKYLNLSHWSIKVFFFFAVIRSLLRKLLDTIFLNWSYMHHSIKVSLLSFWQCG